MAELPKDKPLGSSAFFMIDWEREGAVRGVLYFTVNKLLVKCVRSEISKFLKCSSNALKPEGVY